MINPEKFEEKSDPIKKFNDFKIKLAANSLYLPNYKELKEAFSLLDSSDMEKYDMETTPAHNATLPYDEQFRKEILSEDEERAIQKLRNKYSI